MGLNKMNKCTRKSNIKQCYYGMHNIREWLIWTYVKREMQLWQTKGFPISDLCPPRGVSLIIPPFRKQKKRVLPHGVEATKTIANLRIHVEKEMERIKNFRILTGVVPITGV